MGFLISLNTILGSTEERSRAERKEWENTTRTRGT